MKFRLVLNTLQIKIKIWISYLVDLIRIIQTWFDFTTFTTCVYDFRGTPNLSLTYHSLQDHGTLD